MDGKRIAGDAVWYKDPKVLFKRYAEFFPARDHTPEEKVNAIVRLSFYIAAALTAVAFARTRSLKAIGKYFFMAALATAIVSLAYKGGACYPSKQFARNVTSPKTYGIQPSSPSLNREPRCPAGAKTCAMRIRNAAAENATCTKSTPENPFANVLLTELGDDPDRPAACAYDSQKDLIRKNFNKGLPRNLTDVYEVQNSQRQYMTTPVSTSIPDTHAFAEYVFGSGLKGCKWDTAKCTGHN